MERRSTLVLVVLALLLATACRAAATPTPTPVPPIVVQDSRGVEVRLEGPPRRIVSLSPAHTEMLFAIGAGDLVVGTDSFSDYPPRARDLPKVGDAFNVNLEALAGLEPDLVVVSFTTFVEKMEQAGLKVMVLEPPTTLEGVLEQVRLVGRATGHREEADALAEQMGARLEAVRQRVAGVERGPRVFVELDPTLYTAGPGSFIGDILRLLKAQNIAGDAQGPYPQLSPEVVISRDPEVIILLDGFSESPETVQARPGWENITAVREGRVYVVDPDIVSRPGPRLVEGVERLADLLYGQPSGLLHPAPSEPLALGGR